MLRRGSRSRHNSATGISTTVATPASSSSSSSTTPAAATTTPSSDDIMCTSSTSPSTILPRTPTVAPNDHSDHTGEISQVSTATTTSTATESSGTARALFSRSASNGRREKRRFFRRLRSYDRNSSQNGSLGGSSGGVGRCGGTTASQPSDSDEDTLGSLPHEPPHMISSNMISSPPPTTTSSTTPNHHNNNNNTSPRRVASPSVPGAIAARGRAFGEIPQWARVPVNRQPSPLAGVPTPRGDHATFTPTSDSNTNTTTPTATNATPNNNNATPLNVRVPRRSISDPPRGAFGSLHPNPSSRVMRSTSNGSATGGNLTNSMLGRSGGSSSFFGNVGSLFSSFRLSGNQHPLPEAEILDSEKVVYAEVVEPEDNPFGWLACPPALLVYSIILVLVGIMIGRWSVQYPSWDKEL